MADPDDHVITLLAESRKTLENLDIPIHFKDLLLATHDHAVEQLQHISNVVAKLPPAKSRPTEVFACNPVQRENTPESVHLPESINGSERGSQTPNDVSAHECASQDDSDNDEVEKITKLHFEQTLLRNRNKNIFHESGRFIRPEKSFVAGINFSENGDSPRDDPEWMEDSPEVIVLDDEEYESSEGEMDQDTDEEEESVAISSQKSQVCERASCLDESANVIASSRETSWYNTVDLNSSQSMGSTRSHDVEGTSRRGVLADLSERQSRLLTISDAQSLATTPRDIQKPAVGTQTMANAPVLPILGTNAHEPEFDSEDERVLDQKLHLRRSPGPSPQPMIISTSTIPAKRFLGDSDHLSPRKQIKLPHHQSQNKNPELTELEAVLKSVFEAQKYCEAFARGACCELQHVDKSKLEKTLFHSNLSLPLENHESERLYEQEICPRHMSAECCNKAHKTSDEILQLLQMADEDLAAYFTSTLNDKAVTVATDAHLETMSPLTTRALRSLGICVEYYGARHRGLKGHCDKMHVSVETAKEMIAISGAHPTTKLRRTDELGACRAHLGYSKAKDMRPCCKLPHPAPLEMVKQVDEFISEHLRRNPALASAVDSRTKLVLRAIRGT